MKKKVLSVLLAGVMFISTPMPILAENLSFEDGDLVTEISEEDDFSDTVDENLVVSAEEIIVDDSEDTAEAETQIEKELFVAESSEAVIAADEINTEDAFLTEETEAALSIDEIDAEDASSSDEEAGGIVPEEEAAESVSEGDEDSFAYNITEAGAEITGYTGADTVVEVPETLGGASVVKIADSAFSGNTAITEVVLSDTVIEIGQKAFYQCTALEKITLSNNLTSIGNNAFYNCTKLTTAGIPASVTSIGNYAFYNCSVLTGTELLSGLTSIGTYAFYGCAALTEIEVPDTVSTIGSCAFTNCSGLTKVTLGSGIASLPSYIFRYCSSLKTLNINGTLSSVGSYALGSVSLTDLNLGAGVTSVPTAILDMESLESITTAEGNTTLKSENGVLYSADGTKLLRYPRAKTDESFTVPETVTVIEEYSFYQAKSLAAVTLPTNLVTIENYAFCYCTGLTEITVPDQVTVIGNYAFDHCTGLTKVSLGKNVNTLGDYAFNYCTSLKTINLECDLTSVGKNAFGNVTLTTLNLGENVTSIEALTDISKIETLTVAEGNKTFKVSDGILYSADGTILVQYPVSKTDESFTIPETVTAIQNRAFYNNKTLTSVEFPSGLKTIGSYAFYGCTGLTGTLTFDGVETIGEYAFYGCTGLAETLTLNSTGTVGGYAFYGCTGLTGTLTLDGVGTIGEYAFYGCKGLTGLDVTAPGYSAGDADAAGQDADADDYSIGAYAFTNCSNITEINFTGDAPEVNASSFSNVSSALFYDAGAAGWEAVLTAFETGSKNLMLMERGEYDRAIALVLDCSGSMSGDPMDALKTAVESFCNTIMSGEQKTQIVLICYGSSVSAYGFTSQLSALTDRTDNLSAGMGSTNIYDAVSKADSYLKTVSALEKDLIIMTDGMPNEGTTSSSGPFTSSDNSCYKYANAVCNLYDSLDSNYRIFSMGFFHSLSEDSLAFAGSFLEKIQNCGYYEVTEIDDLISAFEKMTESLLTPLEVTVTEECITVVALDSDDTDDSYEQIVITATVYNQNSLNATNVKAKLKLADGMTLLEGTEEQELGELEMDATKTITWKTKVPLLLTDHTYQYSVAVGADNAVATEIFRDVTVDMYQASDRTIGEDDRWSFKHGRVASYDISDEYKNYLEQCVTPSEWDDIVEMMWGEEAKSEGWGGSCFGMTLAAALFKDGKLIPQYWDDTAEKISELSITTSVRDLINYYFALQKTKTADDCLQKYGTSASLKLLEEKLASGNGFVQVDISYGGIYNCDISDHTKGEEYGAGHALLAYGDPVEEEHTFAGVTYSYYIKIYDINKLGQSETEKEESYLYYTADKTEFCVPNYTTSTNGKSYVDYTNWGITRVIDNWDAFDNYNPEKKDYQPASVRTNDARLSANTRTMEIRNSDGSRWTVDGLKIDGPEGIWSYYDAIESDVEPEQDLNVLFENPDAAYTITANTEEALKLRMKYDDSLSRTNTSSDSTVTFEDANGVSVSDNTGSYKVAMVFDEGAYTAPWNKIEVDGSGRSVSVTQTNEGYVVKTDDSLNGVVVTVSNGDDQEQIEIPDQNKEVLVTEADNKVVIKGDSDGDGTYDKILNATAKDISGEDVTVEIADQFYTGEPLTPAAVIKDAGKILTGNVDYTITYTNNTKIGTAAAVITGIGNYTGSRTVNFSVVEEAHSWGEERVVTSADVFKAATCEHTCLICGKTKTYSSGSALKATIKVNAKSVPLQKGKSTTAIKVTGLAAGDYVKSWKSNKPRIATVNSKGKITAKRVGKAKITITLASKKKATVTIKVQKAKVTTRKLKVSSKQITLKAGETYNLLAVKTPVTSTEKITYKSSDKKVVTVSKSGKLKAKKAGKATITVKSGKKTVKVKVTVKWR